MADRCAMARAGLRRPPPGAGLRRTFTGVGVLLALGSPCLGDATAHAAASSTRIPRTHDQPDLTRYVLLTDVHLAPNGGSIWLTTGVVLEGLVHTNGELRFKGQPIFADTVSSVNDRAWFYNNGIPRELAADSNGTTDAPEFQRGFIRGAAPVALPGNSYDQQALALGIAPDGSQPTNAAIRSSLGLPPGSTPPPDGIYVAGSMGRMVGGIYVQGNADQILATADTILNRQTYRVTQGPVVKTITIDPEAITTSVTAGMTTTVYQGLPSGVLFVNGAVADLEGPDRIGPSVLPALLDGQRLLVAATGDIVIQGDVTVRGFDTGTSVIGIFSSAGSVRIGARAPNDVNLDAFVIAAGPNGIFGVDDYGVADSRGTLHLRGGCVSSYFGPFGTFSANGAIQSGYGREFRHDGRGLTPPGYPTASWPVSGVAPTNASAPSSVSLSIAGPNPVRGTMRVRYTLESPGRVRLTLFDVLGRRIATLVNAERSEGANQAIWAPDRSPERTPSGVYLLRLESMGSTASVRVVLLR